MSVHKWKSEELAPLSMQLLQFPAFLLHFNFERTQKIIFSLEKKKKVEFYVVKLKYTISNSFYDFHFIRPPSLQIIRVDSKVKTLEDYL